MSFLSTPDLRQRLAAAIRSGGQGGPTSAQDLRDFLGLLLDELEAAEAATPAPPAAADVVHLAGAETITGLKTFTGDVLVGNGQDGSGLKIRKPSGEGYQRLLDVTNVDRPNSINFGAVGEGGDLRYHGTTHRWLANGGGPARMLLDEQSALAVAGPVQATAFVGDGAQLTNLPASQRFSGTKLELGGHEALRYDAAANALVQGGGPDNLDAIACANNFTWTGNGTGQRMLLDTGSNLILKGQVRAAAFVGDGSQLTSLPAVPRCRATGPAVSQLLGDPNGPPTPLRFGAATGTGYDPATGRYTAGRAGLHAFTLGLMVDNTSVGGELYIGLTINGAYGVVLQHWQHTRVGLGGGAGYAEIELAATDYVELGFKHDNGNQPFQVQAEPYYTYFTGRWVSA